MGNRSYQLTSASQSAHDWQICQHWLAGNSFFPCCWIFISSFSEPLGINIEGLNSLLLGIQLFIQIYFDRVWLHYNYASGTEIFFCGKCAFS